MEGCFTFQGRWFVFRCGGGGGASFLSGGARVPHKGASVLVWGGGFEKRWGVHPLPHGPLPAMRNLVC